MVILGQTPNFEWMAKTVQNMIIIDTFWRIFHFHFDILVYFYVQSEEGIRDLTPKIILLKCKQISTANLAYPKGWFCCACWLATFNDSTESNFISFFAFESWAGEDLSLKIDKLDQAISKCDLEYKMI